MPSKKLQRNAEKLRRSFRGLPWREAFSQIARLSETEIPQLFDCWIFNTPEASNYRPCAVVASGYLGGFNVVIGLSFASAPDVRINLLQDNFDIVFGNVPGQTAPLIEDRLTFVDVLFMIRGWIITNVRIHVNENMQHALDTLKLAAQCKMTNVIPVDDLGWLVKFVTATAKRKRVSTERRMKTLKDAKSELDAAGTQPTRKPKKDRPRTSLRGFKWYEATAEQAIDAQGFIATEQADASWLVTYNNRAPVRAFSEAAAIEYISDISKDTNRLKEFVATSAFIKTVTIVRLNKQK